MSKGRYRRGQIELFVQQVLEDGICVLPEHVDRVKLAEWREAFAPLLARHIEREGDRKNRGTNRYYVTLPFIAPFADPEIYEDEDILAIVRLLVGEDCVLHQLATDPPLLGSEYQELHRDAPPLFPETGQETPPFQLAVNFPLVDVTEENGPFETTRGTHMISKEEALRRVESGEAPIEPLLMKAGDVMVRDVRGLHRGTPNRTDEARPMVVLGYSRRWLFRPEVSIRVPRATFETLSDRAKFLLRFNPVVERIDDEEPEVYQSFAY